ncbi:hypothetical protein FIM02_03160, partial [SAR202 cluster bacterium AD-802-E10_MRT_200m]|nr:hypothetical protein [SAR202 cluster bacterium AD-802-E10_MRT_200m]
NVFALHLAEDGRAIERIEEFIQDISLIFPIPDELQSSRLQNMDYEETQDVVIDYAHNLYDQLGIKSGIEQIRNLERLVMLRAIDAHWVGHLTAMENLRQGIGLHAYGQRDPLVMYNTEAHEKFQEVLGLVQRDIAHTIFHVTDQLSNTNPEQRKPRDIRNLSQNRGFMAENKSSDSGLSNPAKIGRNLPCPCGSGRKYKRCHGSGG